MSRRLETLIIASVFVFGLVVSGCAGTGSPSGADDSTSNGDRVAMDQSRLEQVFSDQVEAITGPTGALQSKIEGVPIYCISDPARDRMRIIAPIARIEGIDPRIHEILLRANFGNSLDARYAISEGVIFATYLHPISSLTAREIESAVEQVIHLAKSFGTSFSGAPSISPSPGASSDGGPSGAEEDERAR